MVRNKKHMYILYLQIMKSKKWHFGSLVSSHFCACWENLDRVLLRQGLGDGEVAMQAVWLWMITRNALKSHLATCLKTKRNKPQPFTFSCTYSTVKKWRVDAGNPPTSWFSRLELCPVTQIWHVFAYWHRPLPVLCLADFPVFLSCTAFELFVLSFKVPYRLALAHECKSHGTAGRGILYTHILCQCSA